MTQKLYDTPTARQGPGTGTRSNGASRERALKLAQMLLEESTTPDIRLLDGVFCSARELALAFEHMGLTVRKNLDGSFTASKSGMY